MGIRGWKMRMEDGMEKWDGRKEGRKNRDGRKEGRKEGTIGMEG